MMYGKLVKIKTPEGIEFPLMIAGPISRFLALAIDQLAINIITVLLYAVLSLAMLISS